MSSMSNLADNESCARRIKKIDLVMWTLNSAKTLPFALKSIEKAIPQEYINQKIIVDGHSTDETQNIGKKFGWTVLDAKKVGIPNQANQALKLVTTEFFASFEHDIVLTPDWFLKILKHLESDPEVAVAQGVRVTTNPVFRIIEEYSLGRDLRYSSLDNTIYRTEVIKRLGGFDPKFPVSADRNLQDRVWKAGYKWVIDKTVVSDHMRGTVRQTAAHVYELRRFADYPDNPSVSSLLPRFIFSPIRGVEISLKKRCPHVALVYPYWRFMMLKASLDAFPKQR